MKTKNKMARPATASASASEMHDAMVPYGCETATAKMVRTQIYLEPTEHDFVRREACRRAEPMAAVIRAYIREKMTLPEDAWQRNPLLEPTVEDPTAPKCEDGSINHDHYIYGTPKKYKTAGGKWKWIPLPQ